MARRCKECIHSDLCKDMHRFGIVDLPYNADGAACYHFGTADVVEVVRCKDCKHYKQNPWNKETDMLCQCYSEWHATEPNDFCSYGKRKEETT